MIRIDPTSSSISEDVDELYKLVLYIKFTAVIEASVEVARELKKFILAKNPKFPYRDRTGNLRKDVDVSVIATNRSVTISVKLGRKTYNKGYRYMKKVNEYVGEIYTKGYSFKLSSLKFVERTARTETEFGDIYVVRYFVSSFNNNNFESYLLKTIGAKVEALKQKVRAGSKHQRAGWATQGVKFYRTYRKEINV